MCSDIDRSLQPEEVLAEELTELGRYLREWPDAPIPEALTSPHLVRLAACLRAFRDTPGAVGWADLAALIRQALRVGDRSVLERSAELRLTVPVESAGSTWPSAEQWASCGVNADPVDGTYQLIARPWCPPWSDRGAPVDERVSTAPFRSCRTA